MTAPLSREPLTGPVDVADKGIKLPMLEIVTPLAINKASRQSSDVGLCTNNKKQAQVTNQHRKANSFTLNYITVLIHAQD
jgi:hypothetical protein